MRDLYIDADKKILNQWKNGFDILEKINLNYNYSKTLIVKLFF